MLSKLPTDIWATLAPVLIFNTIIIVTMMTFWIKHWKKLETPEYLKGRQASRFVSAFFREWWYWLTNPVAKFFIKIRLNPNSITIIGTLIGFSSAYFYAKGNWGYAGWIMVFGATFDMFDGRVARILGKQTRSGAYLDSTMDRYGEGVTFLGLAYFFRNSWMLSIVIVGLICSMMVSYTRARGEGVGVVCKKGIMQRPERIVYLGVSAILQPFFDSILSIFWNSPPPVLVMGAVILVAVMTLFTSVQRIIYIMNELDNMDRDEEKLSLPQMLASMSTKQGRDKAFKKAQYGYDRTKSLKELVVMILVDGANYSVFKNLVAKGELPNISRYIIETGSFKKAITTFPSTTGPAFTPFITGCFAGTADIPGARWFDRRVPYEKRLTIKRFRDYFGWGLYAIDSDLSRDVKTIFEYSRKAINIMGVLNRGAGVLRDPAFLRAPALFYQAKSRENIEAVERTAYRMFLNSLSKTPDFIFYYFPTIDKYSHQYNSSHETVIEAYKRLDDYVGKMVKEVDSRNMMDRTSFILTSDHGHSDVEKHFDLDKFFEKRYKTIFAPSRFREWLDAGAINMSSGNAMSNVYLKGRDWFEPRYFEDLEKDKIIDDLLAEEAVDLLMGRSKEGGVIISGRRGRARVQETDEGKIKYSVLGNDPFGYENIPHEMEPEEELKKTIDTPYPDAIMQAAQVFRSGRAGDIVISVSPGHDLRDRFENPPHSSTHGAIHSEHMEVPMCISEKIGDNYIRTADIFPTVLKMLGIKADHEMDGRALV